MTYEEFVKRYCDGMTPTAAQEATIRNALRDPGGQLIWTGGRASGKATVRGWLARYFDDLRVQPCGKLFEKADEPWTYRCVLPAGHDGDCDPQLRPPPGPAAPAEPPLSGTPAEALFGEFGDWLRRLRGMEYRTAQVSIPTDLVLAAADAIDGLTEEVANLSSEGLLRMGVGNSPIRYHAHGEVLWPVGPHSGMCRGCAG